MSSEMSESELAEFRRRDFEQQVVCKILRAGGVLHRLREFRDEQYEVSGCRQLSLKWFGEQFPRFPLRLGATLLAEAPLWPELFLHFTTLPFFKAYCEWRDAEGLNDRGPPLGLVFNLEAVTLVLHTYSDAPSRPNRRLTRLIGRPPVEFQLEPLEFLLQGIGKDWATPCSSKATEGDKQ